MTEENITTGKAGAQGVLSDMEIFFNEAYPYYSNLTPQQRQAFFTTITTGWATANAAQKADALRGLLSLLIVAIYFLYLKLIGE